MRSKHAEAPAPPAERQQLCWTKLGLKPQPGAAATTLHSAFHMQPVSGRPPAAGEPKLLKQLGAAGSRQTQSWLCCAGHVVNRRILGPPLDPVLPLGAQDFCNLRFSKLDVFPNPLISGWEAVSASAALCIPGCVTPYDASPNPPENISIDGGICFHLDALLSFSRHRIGELLW